MLDRVPAERRPQINVEVQKAPKRYPAGKKIAFGAIVVLASARK